MSRAANLDRTNAICAEYRAFLADGISSGKAALELSAKYDVQRPAIWKALRRGGVLPPYAPRQHGGSGRPISGGVAGWSDQRRQHALGVADERQAALDHVPVREPCFLCGARADVGCRHRRAA